MPNYLNNVWLVGCGIMAVEYSKVLDALGISYTAIGRGESSARSFEEQTKHSVICGGLHAFLEQKPALPEAVIVASSMSVLQENTQKLLDYGVKQILVEKPAGCNREEIRALYALSKKKSAQVYIAYNRRFYASVLAALPRIEEEGGATSFHFDFTEWSHVIEKMKGKEEKELQNWIYGNSSHIIDMAFYMCGWPALLQTNTVGGLRWHNAGSIFSGAGVSEKGALFSYHANWESAGRWSVEVHTKESTYIFRPLEKLQVQKRGEIAITEVMIDDEMDHLFKPGIYREVASFLNCNDTAKKGLKSLCEQAENTAVYDAILYGENMH